MRTYISHHDHERWGYGGIIAKFRLGASPRIARKILRSAVLRAGLRQRGEISSLLFPPLAGYYQPSLAGLRAMAPPLRASPFDAFATLSCSGQALRQSGRGYLVIPFAHSLRSPRAKSPGLEDRSSTKGPTTPRHPALRRVSFCLLVQRRRDTEARQGVRAAGLHEGRTKPLPRSRHDRERGRKRG
jgi:hypothetical protein